MKESSENKLKQLEQMVGKKQIEIEYLEKMIEIAKDDLQIDIKKITTPNITVVQTTLRTKEIHHECFV